MSARLVGCVIVGCAAIAACGAQSRDERLRETFQQHPPEVYVVDRGDLMKAFAAADARALIAERGEPADAPAYEGWFWNMLDFYFLAEHQIDREPDRELGELSAGVAQRTGLWLSIITPEERSASARIAEIDPSEAELAAYHADFLAREADGGRLPEVRDSPVSGEAMGAWLAAYPELVALARGDRVVVIMWDGADSARRVLDALRTEG